MSVLQHGLHRQEPPLQEEQGRRHGGSAFELHFGRCCFDCPRDSFQSDMVSHADTEMVVMKEDACYIHRSLETGGTTCHAGVPSGEA